MVAPELDGREVEPEFSKRPRSSSTEWERKIYLPVVPTSMIQ
jgi:hypothetical protein